MNDGDTDRSFVSGESRAGTGALRRLWLGLRAEWREIGGLGRLALAGLALSLALTVVLGFSISNSARTNLLAARADLLASQVSALPLLGADVVPGSDPYAVFDGAVQRSLVGGETERVKVWAADGTIVYSDLPSLVGQSFDLSPPARGAFDGHVETTISDLEDPAHAHAESHSQLIEVYIPHAGADGSIDHVVEVEQRLDSLNEALGSIRRNVWLSIGAGMGALAIFLGALGVARARSVDRRRRQAERLLGALFRVQEDEQRRIVGALHDDVGQPLYRLLYGLEGSRAKLPHDDPVADELDRLEGLVRDIDKTLRGELDLLYHGLAADAGLVPALRDLAGMTEGESGIDVHTSFPDRLPTLSPVARTALFRAAQEAVVNVRKHAGAGNVWIRVETQGDRVAVDVEDDGTGTLASPGLGLTTTRERLEALGGGLRVEQRKRTGTRFSAWLPVDAAR